MRLLLSAEMYEYNIFTSSQILALNYVKFVEISALWFWKLSPLQSGTNNFFKTGIRNLTSKIQEQYNFLVFVSAGPVLSCAIGPLPTLLPSVHIESTHCQHSCPLFISSPPTANSPALCSYRVHPPPTLLPPVHIEAAHRQQSCPLFISSQPTA